MSLGAVQGAGLTEVESIVSIVIAGRGPTPQPRGQGVDEGE